MADETPMVEWTAVIANVTYACRIEPEGVDLSTPEAFLTDDARNQINIWCAHMEKEGHVAYADAIRRAMERPTPENFVITSRPYVKAA